MTYEGKYMYIEFRHAIFLYILSYQNKNQRHEVHVSKEIVRETVDWKKANTAKPVGKNTWISRSSWTDVELAIHVQWKRCDTTFHGYMVGYKTHAT